MVRLFSNQRVFFLAMVCFLLQAMFVSAETLSFGHGPEYRVMTEEESNLSTVEFKNKHFTKVEIFGPFTVDVKQGDSYSIRVTADPSILPKVKILQTVNKINIYFLSQMSQSKKFFPKIEITMPVLTNFQLRGACTGTMSGFSGKRLILTTNDASTLVGTDLHYDLINIDAEELSRIDFSGIHASISRMEVEASNAAKVDVSNIEAKEVEVDLNGVAIAIVKMNGGKILGWIREASRAVVNGKFDVNVIRHFGFFPIYFIQQ